MQIDFEELKKHPHLVTVTRWDGKDTQSYIDVGNMEALQPEELGFLMGHAVISIQANYNKMLSEMAPEIASRFKEGFIEGQAKKPNIRF